jgi:hypothetical protein
MPLNRGICNQQRNSPYGTIINFKPCIVMGNSMSDIASAPSGPVGAASLPRQLLTDGRSWASRRSRLGAWVRSHLADIAELAAIGLWGLWVGRAFLNLDQSQWPFGDDFPRNIQLMFQWPLLLQCGPCVLWNGSINGGAPAFGDFFSPILYPPVVVTTMFWGGIAGAKLTIVISLVLAGVAQWWLARVLGLGRVARLWVAAVAVVGGHIAGRMQMGHVVMVTSVTACSLVLAPALEVGLSGRRRSVVALALAMALALVSGHGYIQVAILFGVLPALLVLLWDDQFRLRLIWKNYVLAAGLTILLAAVYWLPLLNFWPSVTKEGDPYFAGAQPVIYTMLNLVIRERAFFDSEVLFQKPLPAMHMNYIGWVPVALALVALRLVPRQRWRTLAFLMLAAFLIFLASSAFWFKLINDVTGGFFSVGRHISLLAPLAVPLVLAVSAWGLDALLKLNWPRLTLSLAPGRVLGVSTVWLLAVPLLWGVRDLYLFSHDYLITQNIPGADYPAEEFSPDSTEWVAIPFGELRYIARALSADVKIVLDPAFTAWNWAGRELPPARIALSRDVSLANDPNYAGMVNGVLALEYADRHYAFVDTGQAIIPCQAAARGGNIDVHCQTDAPGVLTVRENAWSGWGARLDGTRLNLRGGQWLSVSIPPGDHQIAFRYRPWDVAVGLLLTVIGIAVAVRLWLRPVRGWPDGVPLGAA